MAQNVLLPLAARTTTTTTSVYNRSWNERGAHFILNVTAAPGVETLTFILEGRDALGNFYPLLTSTADATTGIRNYELYPNVDTAANLRVRDFLPDAWRVRVVHSAAGSFTYSLCANTMN